jgi:hypothetical protein
MRRVFDRTALRGVGHVKANMSCQKAYEGADGSPTSGDSLTILAKASVSELT